MAPRVLADAARLPVFGLGVSVSVVRTVASVPQRVDGIVRGIESLERIAELDDSIRLLSTFEQSLARLADLGESVDRLSMSVGSLPGLADSAASLPELTKHAAALTELTEHAGALAELTKHAAALQELTEYAATLPELTQHAAALPELAPRVRSVELMVQKIIGYLETLQPTVDELTLAASDLHRAVGPIGRIAGRLPGSKARTGTPALDPPRRPGP